jgi:exonuclease VII small subunit
MRHQLDVLLLCGSLVLASGAALSPVSRVVELLQALGKTIEEEGKKEEDLYESYVCWANSVIEQKTASNVEADARIDTLETYIADLDAGRIELSSERIDLEKDIASLMSELEEAKALRAKEKADFEDAKAEMTSAIDALQSAIDVLEKATAAHKEGVFLAVRSRLGHKSESFAQQHVNLQNAVTLGERFLSKADATFLRRLLTGDVPDADWKKLNRKAVFKMKYKGRSFKIQDLLNKMHGTFKSNLADAIQKEADAQGEYETLASAKQDQLDAAQEALSKSEVENGKRGQSKEESTKEVADLKKQVVDDTKFIADTQKALDKKKADWKIRSDLRAGELEAVSKAISILHNDDARDNMKRSFASQEGLLFLQRSQTSLRSSKALGALTVLKQLAQKTGDTRLAAIETLAAEPQSAKLNFKPIIAAIDKLVKILEDQEADDLKIKQDCEQGRMEDTRSAILDSRAVDVATEAVNKLTSEVEELQKQIVSLEESLKQTKEELAEAASLRKKENADFLVNDKDDQEAHATVESAIKVLDEFYKANFALVQRSAAPVVEAGKAPPPPPPTWDAGYGGKKDESTGIISMLEMVAEDIVKDRQKAKAEEAEALASFEKFKKQAEDEMKDIVSQIKEAKSIMGKKDTDIEEAKTARRDKKGSLDSMLKKIKDIDPNCEYFEETYVMRVKNRQVEVDGLNKAKAILQGGVFDAPDPNREIKPGDAFLQKRF